MSETWLPTLITETPQGGYALAVKLARTAVKLTQADPDIRNEYMFTSMTPQRLFLFLQLWLPIFKRLRRLIIIGAIKDQDLSHKTQSLIKKTWNIAYIFWLFQSLAQAFLSFRVKKQGILIFEIKANMGPCYNRLIPFGFDHNPLSR